MKQRIPLVEVAVVVLVIASGCGRTAPQQPGDTDAHVAVDSAPPVSDEPSVAQNSRPPEAAVADNTPVLAHGDHMVYGIRMPRGMMPIQAGGSVRRFEGTHSIEAVKTYIVAQLAGKIQIAPNRFGKGYFISDAIPKSSQRDLARVEPTAKKYHIKIFDGSLGGAGIDIWEALPGENKVSGGRSTMANITGASRKKPMSRSGTAPKVELKHPKQREKALFGVFDKMTRKKTLTEEDLQSPFFTDQ